MADVAQTLAAGQTAVRRLVVQPHHLASALACDAGEAYPALLSTPSVIAEMERAAATLLRPLLGPDQVSVGARFEKVSHLAPTPLSAWFETRVTYAGTEGALHWFDIEAADHGGIIARCRHARAIVDAEELTMRAIVRCRDPA
jgi:predicted thioesterase